MEAVPVNYAAVLVCAVVSMGIGYLWYGPFFGKPWMKEMGFKKESMDAAMKKGMGKTYGMMFAGSILMAWVLAHALIFSAAYMGLTGVSSGLITGFFNWLGFVVPVSLGSVLWDGKSWKLYGINTGYYLVTLLAMSTILAVWV
jgi:hypothetical protein